MKSLWASGESEYQSGVRNRELRLSRQAALPAKLWPPPYHPSKRDPNAGLMLGQHLRRWPNIKSTLNVT